MIEYLGFLYGLVKDVKNYLTFEEKEKKIDNKYLDQLIKKHQDEGDNINFRWSDADKIEARKDEGWDYYYEIDIKKRKKFILKNKSNQILIAKRN